ncbi:hypothetical protein AVEN_36973-1 [Araneus ventricosus]|uniref:Uncharacterized protein n=1 Tax=Araneus ventricosus TaxID=182803 RepID=A0A4Y2IHA4_ARAVE|nr:hypothetical protein AVEN_36973-1 [Araneus ventricosus]
MGKISMEKISFIVTVRVVPIDDMKLSDGSGVAKEGRTAGDTSEGAAKSYMEENNLITKKSSGTSSIIVNIKPARVASPKLSRILLTHVEKKYAKRQ